MDDHEHSDGESLEPLDDIVRELLLERTEGLPPPGLAAFIDGWGSLLRLLDHTSVLLPDASDELHEAFARALARIRAAQARVLDD